MGAPAQHRIVAELVAEVHGGANPLCEQRAPQHQSVQPRTVKSYVPSDIWTEWKQDASIPSSNEVCASQKTPWQDHGLCTCCGARVQSAVCFGSGACSGGPPVPSPTPAGVVRGCHSDRHTVLRGEWSYRSHLSFDRLITHIVQAKIMVHHSGSPVFPGCSHGDYVHTRPSSKKKYRFKIPKLTLSPHREARQSCCVCLNLAESTTWTLQSLVSNFLS